MAGPDLYPLYVLTNSTCTISLEVGASLTSPHFTDEETEMQQGYATSHMGRSMSIKTIKWMLGGYSIHGGQEGERKESEILFGKGVGYSNKLDWKESWETGQDVRTFSYKQWKARRDSRREMRPELDLTPRKLSLTAALGCQKESNCHLMSTYYVPCTMEALYLTELNWILTLTSWSRNVFIYRWDN